MSFLAASRRNRSAGRRAVLARGLRWGVLCVWLCGGGLGNSGGVAHAQALPAATGPGSFVSVGGGISAFQSDYGQRILGGLWAFADVNPDSRVGLEGEFRTLRYHTDEDVTQTSWLGGPRVSLTHGRIRPYVKFLAGAGHIVLPFHYAQGTFLTYAPGAGVDWYLSPRFAVRVIDVQYQVWPQFTYGELHPYGISTGIVIRLTPPEQYPRGTHSRH